MALDHRHLAWLVALLLAPAAAAEQLHKCVAADGHATFQSTPCPAGATTAWTRDYAPDPRPEPPREYARPAPLEVVERNDGQPAPSRSPRRLARDRCRAAREHEAAMRRDHPTLSYEKLSELSNAKSQACHAAR
jgi:hypothetical protein